MINALSKRRLLITGGTGSFGETVMQKFLDTDIGEITILSRDEKKQESMRLKYNNAKLNFAPTRPRPRPRLLLRPRALVQASEKLV